MAVQKLRTVKPGIKIGVCGEHAGDPSSIAFFMSVGVDYISCSPARLSLAQIAMAQTAAQTMAQTAAQTMAQTAASPRVEAPIAAPASA